MIMNSMERVVKTLNHQKSDRMPVYPIISGASRRLINASYKDWSNDADLCARALLKAREELDLDCIVTLIVLLVECDAWGQELILLVNEVPDAVHEAAKEVNETLKEYCQALMDTGVNGIMIDTLFASGSILSKEMWDELEGDLVEDLAAAIREKNGMVMIHNCGERIYFDAQIKRMQPEVISFLYPPDDCKDFKECKEKYGDVTILIGCVTPASAVIGTDEEWDQECRDSIDAMAKGGDSCWLPDASILQMQALTEHSVW